MEFHRRKVGFCALLWLAFICGALFVTLYSGDQSMPTVLLAFIATLSGACLANATTLTSKIFDERGERRDLAGTILAESYRIGRHLLDFNRVIVPLLASPVSREQFGTVLHARPTLLVEFMKRLPLLPENARHPLLQFHDDLSRLYAWSEQLPLAPTELRSWQRSNIRADLVGACCSARALIGALEQIANSGARGDLQHANAKSRAELQEICSNGTSAGVTG